MGKRETERLERIRENEELRRQLAEQKDPRVELGDALLSAQAVYQDIIDRAKERADAITGEAQRRGADILAEARRESEQLLSQSRLQEENAVHRVEAAFQRMRQLHLASIDELNAQWQDFLCSLDPEPAVPAEKAAPAGKEPSAPEEDGLPADLEEKLGAIADQVFSLEEEEK